MSETGRSWVGSARSYQRQSNSYPLPPDLVLGLWGVRLAKDSLEKTILFHLDVTITLYFTASMMRLTTPRNSFHSLKSHCLYYCVKWTATVGFECKLFLLPSQLCRHPPWCHSSFCFVPFVKLFQVTFTKGMLIFSPVPTVSCPPRQDNI